METMSSESRDLEKQAAVLGERLQWMRTMLGMNLLAAMASSALPAAQYLIVPKRLPWWIGMIAGVGWMLSAVAYAYAIRATAALRDAAEIRKVSDEGK